jgi:hypothetical protein
MGGGGILGNPKASQGHVVDLGINRRGIVEIFHSIYQKSRLEVALGLV